MTEEEIDAQIESWLKSMERDIDKLQHDVKNMRFYVEYKKTGKCPMEMKPK